ncbi:MAG TPA: PQQ-binding-like beta-propeller repeat protein [Bryobacteraceae bacterium]|nr:PQQ-binding-like beta-propeller repeat protein [Bryobacteraceae bacterium]
MSPSRGNGIKYVPGMAACLLLGLVLLRGQPAPKKQPYSTWSDYGGSADSMQYSALKQINKSNVSRLELAWSYPVPGTSGRFGFNPIVVDGVMYVLGKENAIVALNASTGEQIWSHAVQGRPTDRGINYWESKDRSDRRLIFSAGSNLQEVNARTGITINTFGNDGLVDLRDGSPRRQGGPTGTPGRVFENLILLGSAPGESYGSALGDLRAFDVLTGKMVWIFHTTPRPGEYGYDTWPKDAWTYVGGNNTWGEISIDEKRGIAYFPTGSPTYDFYGADRIGAGLFGDCLIALDARTGKRLWHFQAVHHDLWDYDLTTGPKLLTVRHDGKMVDVVAEPTKFGFLYVFNRVTGEPLWPIEERPVPKSDVPGEESWPTQPFPTRPPPFTRQKFTLDDINPYVDDAEKARLRDLLLHARNEGIFTPPATHNTIDMPGELGGCNWGGAAADPATGMLYVRSNDAPTLHILSERQRVRLPEGATVEQRGYALFAQHCESCHGADRKGVTSPKELGAEGFASLLRSGRGQMPAFPVLSQQDVEAVGAYLVNPAAGAISGRAGGGGRGGRGGPPVPPPPAGQTRYYTPYGTLDANNGLPAIGPPWSELTAYDLNAGTIKWQVPLGVVKSLAAKGITNTGSYHPTRNGLVVTAGGLIFIGTWSDRTLRAYDKDTGMVLWEKELEANPEGLPSVYETGGRQYIAFCARSGRVFDNIGTESMAWEPGKPEAQGYYVFALPKGE